MNCFQKEVFPHEEQFAIVSADKIGEDRMAQKVHIYPLEIIYKTELF